jgi:integrase
MDKKKFSLPKVSPCETFIYFSYLNPENLKFKRFKKYLSRTTHPIEYKQELKNLVDFWTFELRNGYNPFKAKTEEQHKTSYLYINPAVDEICANRSEFLREKTQQTYTSKITIFKEWILKKKMSNILINNFTKDDAEEFLRYLCSDRNIGATTRNTYLLTLRTLFKTMKESGILNDNVWEKIPKVGETRLGKLPLKPIMKNQLKNYFIENDPEMWLFVQLEYYCFIRPGELRLLTVGAIDLDDATILIDAKISKNKKSEYVIIPPPLLKYLEKIEICKYKHNNYLFSPGGTPGTELYSKDVFNRRHKTTTRKFGYNDRYSLYSWKHTGAYYH